jgi:cobalt-zinc-cadmium efflux system outer membrane protein
VVREEPGSAVSRTDVMVSWKLPDGARGPVVSAREQAVAAAELRRTQRLADLRSEMRGVYAEWALAVERERRLGDHARRVAALAAREAARAERGEASGLEARRLELAASALGSRVALAAAAGERARAVAGQWHRGLPATAVPDLPELAMPADEPAPRSVLVAAAATDLEAALLERRAAGRFVRSPELAFGWQREEVGTESLDGPVFGFAWSLPLFDRNRAERAAADAAIAAARARQELVERRVEAEREAARASLARLAAALAEAHEALALGERMLDGAEAAFRLGETGVTDLLDTHRTLVEAELAALDLHEAALAAHRELERLGHDPSHPTTLSTEETLP